MSNVIADVFDVLLIDSNGDAVGTSTLQDAGIEISVQESDVRGGQGNQLLGVLHSDRDIALNITDITFRYDWLAKQFGQPIVTGAGVAYEMPRFYDVVGATPTVTLASTPNDPSSVLIYSELGQEISTFTLSGATVTFSAGAVDGDRVEVRTYTYATPATSEEIVIDNAVFAKGVKAVLETIEIDPSTEQAMNKLQWIFDNALPSGNFSINTTSAREAVAQTFNMRVVKPKTSTIVGRSIRIPIS